MRCFLSVPIAIVALVLLFHAQPSHASDAGKVRVHPIDAQGLDRALDATPHEHDGNSPGAVIWLPTPEGVPVAVRMVEVATLSPALQSTRPYLRTYAGVLVEDSTVPVRLTRSERGFHARVLGPEGWTVDSMSSSREGEALVGRNADDPAAQPAHCGEVELLTGKTRAPWVEKSSVKQGEELRVLRLALTGTGEFAVFHGGIANAEAQLVILVNLANPYFERDLAVRMEIVDLNVYPDPATDPFTNGTAITGTALNENHAALIAKLGSGGFDLGHVVSRLNGGGWSGLAAVAVPCDPISMGRGGTFAASPTAATLFRGILHEMGHQLGASHSFNGSTGSCGANRASNWAYEIGSGISIMSYAGTCGVEDVTRPRVLMYNDGSIEAIQNTLAEESSCGQSLLTGNTPPVADAGPDLVIPRGTAFVLDGSASYDVDPDVLSYSWEQHDLGPPSPPYGPELGPIFRNYPQVSSPLRTVPSYSGYRNGLLDVFETLPSVDRIVTMRLVVRDNSSGGGGVAWDTKVLTVTGEPFRILSPNGGESLEGGVVVPLDWQVGGGSVASAVRVLLSDDRGDTWQELLSSTPNDGSELVTLPCGSGSEYRIRLEAIGNRFFDISDGDFNILPDATAPQITCPPPFEVTATSENGIDKDDPALAAWIANLVVSDDCDPDPTVSLATGQTIPVGVNQVTFVAQDDAGLFAFCNTQLTVTAGTPVPALSMRTALLGSYPNPFNPRTTIRFRLARRQTVLLEVLDAKGRRLDVVEEGILDEGIHEPLWDGSGSASGVYFVRLVTEDGSFRDRITLLK